MEALFRKPPFPPWTGRRGQTSRNAKLRSLYGITAADAESLLSVQGGECPICGTRIDLWSGPEGAVVDHNHRTGEVRGILCGPCNKGLGFFKDSPTRLEAAASYLKLWR